MLVSYPSLLRAMFGCVSMSTKLASWCLILALPVVTAVNHAAPVSDHASVDPPIEEIVVVAVERCGPWPIQHSLTEGCDYAELTRDGLKSTRALRVNILNNCLRCKDGICHPFLDGESRQSKFICKKVFWTPKRVGRVTRNSQDHGPLEATFSYSVTTRGRVSDITINSLYADLSEDVVLTLIQQGAERTRFEPLTIDGRLQAIIGITDSYLLDPLMWFGNPQ